MAKNILILTLLTCILTHGMETNFCGMTKNSLNIISHRTKINLIKGYWEDATNTVSLMVVGRHQQKMLQAENHDNLTRMGSLYCDSFSGNSIHKRNKETDSASDDDTYKPHPNHIDKQTWRDSQRVKNLSMSIEEPCIRNTTRAQHTITYDSTDFSSYKDITQEAICINDFVYEVHRGIPNKKDMYYHHISIHDKAIQEASIDLTLCYNKALTKGIKYLEYYEKTEKNIAFPTLGADVGFPRDTAAPIAITTVLEWIKNNPNAYETIYFYVKKRSDFARYKLLLLEQCKILHNICLLYFARKHNDSIVSLLPQEIVDCITLFITELSQNK